MEWRNQFVSTLSQDLTEDYTRLMRKTEELFQENSVLLTRSKENDQTLKFLSKNNIDNENSMKEITEALEQSRKRATELENFLRENQNHS